MMLFSYKLIKTGLAIAGLWLVLSMINQEHLMLESGSFLYSFLEPNLPDFVRKIIEEILLNNLEI